MEINKNITKVRRERPGFWKRTLNSVMRNLNNKKTDRRIKAIRADMRAGKNNQ